MVWQCLEDQERMVRKASRAKYEWDLGSYTHSERGRKGTDRMQWALSGTAGGWEWWPKRRQGSSVHPALAATARNQGGSWGKQRQWQMLGWGAAPPPPHLGSPRSESVFVFSSGSQIERDYWVLESICTFQQTLDGVSYTLCLKVVQGSWLEIKKIQNLASVAKMRRRCTFLVVHRVGAVGRWGGVWWIPLLRCSVWNEHYVHWVVSSRDFQGKFRGKLSQLPGQVEWKCFQRLPRESITQNCQQPHRSGCHRAEWGGRDAVETPGMMVRIPAFYESGENQTHKMQVLGVPATLFLFWALGIGITFFTEHKKRSTHFIDSKIHSLGLPWWCNG